MKIDNDTIMQVLIGILIGGILSILLLFILINLGRFMFDKISNFLEYLSKLKRIRKRNKHRVKCGLTKLKVSDYEYR